MKNRNIKRRFERKIEKGWRDYLTLTIHKSHLGLGEYDFPSMTNIEYALGAKYDSESYFVNHYRLYIPDESTETHRMKYIVSLRKESIYETVEDTINRIKKWYGFEADEAFDMTYRIYNDYMYILEFQCGLGNPKYTNDNEEIYWDNIQEVTEGIFCDADEEKYISRLLDMFINADKLRDALHHKNFLYKFFTQTQSSNINNFTDELANLEKYTKTIYFDFDNNGDIHITFAIRYPSFIKPFLKDLKKIVKSNKNINIR